MAGPINLRFLTDTDRVPLAGSGTDLAALAFGVVSQFTNPPAKMTKTLAATSFNSEHAT